LAYLHANGVVHRDLKPTNVLLSWDGRPIILDFNLAEGREDALRRGAGTLYYMAPEQIEAGLRSTDSAVCDERADLFSFGVIVYELLTGRHPFSMPDTSESGLRATRREEFAEWLLGQQRSGCLPLRIRVPDIDPALERLVMGCLAFDSAKRPVSADAIVRALERIQGIRHQLSRWLRRRRLPAAIAAGAAVLTLAGAAYWLSVRPPAGERALQRARTAMRAGQPERAEDELTERLRIEPGDVQARFLRGMARIELDQVPMAAEDFNRVWQETNRDEARAMTAYCMAIRNFHDAAIFHIEALKPELANRAALLNNRAFSNYRMLDFNNMAVRLMSVEKDLDQCLRIDPQLAPAYLNRAELRYYQFNNRKKRDVLLLDSAIKDVDRAMELGLVTHQTCYDAALFRVTHPVLQHDLASIRELLRQAQLHGRDLKRLRNNPKFEPLFEDADFAELLKLPTPARPKKQPDGLVVPVGDNFQ
jgi:eukaryotic-like serine/threonine-protein kinase